MGGVIIAAAVLVVSLAFSRGRSWGFVLYILLSGLLHGAIGFTDDYIKVAKKRSLGLTPKQKIMMQIVSGLILTLWAYFDPQIGAKVVVPYWNVEWNLGLFYIPLMILMFVFMINSANLLDGLDGLCASCSSGTGDILADMLCNGGGRVAYRRRGVDQSPIPKTCAMRP